MMTVLEEYLKDKFVIAGTGSRSFDPEVDVDAAKRCYEQLAVNHTAHQNLVVMSGAAPGWDGLIAMTARLLEIPYVLCIPNRGYGKYYWHEDGAWHHMLEHAAAIEYTMEDVYQSKDLYLRGEHANFVRNRRMVALADAFLVFNEQSRGTRHCMVAIKRANLPYKVLG